MGHAHLLVLCKLCRYVMRQCRCKSADKIPTFDICYHCKLKEPEKMVYEVTPEKKLLELIAQKTTCEWTKQMIELFNGANKALKKTPNETLHRD